MHTCEEILDLISARLDGELTPAQERDLEEHLASCPECRALADDLAGIHAVLPGMNEEPPAFIKENVMARIKASTPAPIPFPVKKAAPRWKAWGGVAAALVLVAAGTFALRGGTGPSATPMTLGIAPDAAPSTAASALPSAAPFSLPGAANESTMKSAPEASAQAASENGNMDKGEVPAESSAPQAQPRSTIGGGTSDDTTQPSATPVPGVPQQMTGLQVAPAEGPSASATPASHMTAYGAAKKLYEEKFAETYPDYDINEMAASGDNFLTCHFSDATLAYVKTTADGTAYVFSYAVTDRQAVWYLVPADGGEIQLLDSEPVE